MVKYILIYDLKSILNCICRKESTADTGILDYPIVSMKNPMDMHSQKRAYMYTHIIMFWIIPLKTMLSIVVHCNKSRLQSPKQITLKYSNWSISSEPA